MWRRRHHAAGLKARVALDAVKGEPAVSELRFNKACIGQCYINGVSHSLPLAKELG